MKTLLGPAIALLALISFATASASVPGAASVTITEPAPVAAGGDAVFNILAVGDRPDGVTLEYFVEGGEVTGVVSLNETGPGRAHASVYVRRLIPGEATLIASLEGREVARGTASFQAGTSLAIALSRETGAGAAARTFAFEVLSAAGAVADVVHLSASGDSDVASALSAPLIPGDYNVRPRFGRDVAADCSNGAFYAISPASAQPVSLPDADLVSFSVRTCPSLPHGYGVDMPYDPQSSAPADVVDQVAGVRSGPPPLPPATGNGDVEKPVLPYAHAHALVGLVITIVITMIVGTLVVRFLAKVAPVRKPGEKRQ